MLNCILNCTFALLLLLQNALGADKEESQDNHPDISCTSTESGRFLVLERHGNAPDRLGKIVGPERHGYITVFEYLGNEKPLRKLYETQILNKALPLRTMLSPDGRFYVTTDEWIGSGTGPFTVVIYDLARREHTAYAGKDFLSDELIRTLPDHGLTGGFKWCGKDHLFNQDSTKLYPTLPSNCKEEGVPYVVVDLPSRTVKVLPIPDADPPDLVPIVQKEWGWIESKATVTTMKTILPKRLTRQATGIPDRVFELAPNEREYIPRR